ncbi:rod shape-determining protein [Streptomyces sp. H10-C2]|uniref:rod shape-determining protein n=1 Tax=unclassified Streptomyces TaxID=2593676 RepID=UPI0024B95587|nr:MULTISPECIES: rod shape-determining protein [unclassified Streptomyces]MDJ0345921.1 rod shape-determining protein [Streptomyces sp. PH10-H1]MDJ0374770.1 rod shape-determining protein [Streptomyces sp. H10-C2]
MTPILERMRRCTVAVDLGAARTRVYLKGQGLIADEPSVVAFDTERGEVVAIGTTAEQLTGRAPDHILVIRPVAGGMVVDVEMARRLLRHVAGSRLRRARLRTPVLRAALSLPHNSPPVARRTVIETVSALGMRRVELVDSLLAAAIGCGLAVEHPEAAMIVLANADTTQVAVLSMGTVVASETVPVGSDTIERAFVEYFRGHHELAPSVQAVRSLHQAIGDADIPPEAGFELNGRDIVSGLVRSVTADTDAARAAMHGPLRAILDGVSMVMRRCPPDLVVDIADSGLTLGGSISRLPGLDSLLRKATGLRVRIADHPDECVALGMGAMIEGTVLRARQGEPVR